MDTTILTARRESKPTTLDHYFYTLNSAMAVGLSVARVLHDVAPNRSLAARIADCGRYPTHEGDGIRIIRRKDGRLMVQGVRWCGTRYCPTCQPRIMAGLRRHWVARAERMAALGGTSLFITVKMPTPDRLTDGLMLLKSTWQTAYPSPSKFQQAPAGYIGTDWCTEIDFLKPNDQFDPHRHGLMFLHEPPSDDDIEMLCSRWPYQIDLQRAESPSAVAAYITKESNQKLHILSLFDLARNEEAQPMAEYLEATQGVRLRQPSRGVSEFLGLCTPDEDATLAAQVLASRPEDEVVEHFSRRDWLKMYASR